MLRLEQPAWLLLWLVVPLLWWVWRRLRQRMIGRYADAAMLPWAAVAGQRRSGRPSALWALTLAWLMWVLVLANPQWGAPRTQQAEAVGSDVVVLLDLSRSMGVDDVPPDRFTAARALIDAVAERLPQDSRIGLRVFDGHSHWVHHMTTDRAVLRYFLRHARIDSLPTRGSRVEVALDETAEALKGSQAVVWVLTDGHEPYWEAQQATPNLKRYGETLGLIITGMGTATGGPVRKMDGKTLYFRNGPAVSVLKRDQLVSLAARLGGVYQDYRPDLADELVRLMTQRQSDRPDAQRHWEWTSLRVWPMALGWLLLMAAFWPLAWRRRK